MRKQIRFTTTGCNTLIGNFSAGDIARVDGALASHLVDEARVALYASPSETAPATSATDESATSEPVRRKSRKHDPDA